MEIRKQLPVKWNDGAFLNLKEIHDNIASHSPKNADAVITRIIELIDGLGNFPEKYPKLELPKKSIRNYRFVSVWTFKIVYEVFEEEVRVIKIFNNSKHPKRLFDGLK